MSIDWMPTKGPKTKRLAEARLHQLLYLQALASSDEVFLETARKEIPEAWHTLEMDLDVRPKKEKVTLYLDPAVIAMFRKMGQGYQARINRILETWMQMKMAEKAALKKEAFEAMAEAREDRDRPEVGVFMKEQYAKLVEHWAYEEGWQDALKRVEAEKTGGR